MEILACTEADPNILVTTLTPSPVTVPMIYVNPLSPRALST